MAGFNKMCGQYPHKFKIDRFFSSMVSFPSPLSAGGNKFLKNAAWEKWAIFFLPGGDDKNLGEFCLGAWRKMNRFNLLSYKCIFQ